MNSVSKSTRRRFRFYIHRCTGASLSFESRDRKRTCSALWQYITLVEAEHRRHAVVEPQGSGARTLPSGHFHANAAWTVIAAIAHNLLRWTSALGLPGRTVRAARTIRRRCSRCPAG
jgi:hypothetical protein